jgi:hypothetical protein
MTATHHDVEHPVFAELFPTVDDHALAELIVDAVTAEGWHPTYDGEEAIGE